MTHTFRPSGSSRRILGALATLAVLGTASACGIGADSTPRALPVNTTTTTTIPEATGDEPSVVYVVQGERLVPLTRQLPAKTPEAVMESLLVPPTSADGSGLSSSIPAATELLGLSLTDDGLLKVNLSADFEDVVGPARAQAIGQIVLSQTLLTQVDRVSFSVDGERLQVSSPERGDVNVVDACDYAGLLADPATEDNDLTEGQATVLSIHRSDLADACEL